MKRGSGLVRSAAARSSGNLLELQKLQQELSKVEGMLNDESESDIDENNEAKQEELTMTRPLQSMNTESLKEPLRLNERTSAMDASQSSLSGLSTDGDVDLPTPRMVP